MNYLQLANIAGQIKQAAKNGLKYGYSESYTLLNCHTMYDNGTATMYNEVESIVRAVYALDAIIG